MANPSPTTRLESEGDSTRRAVADRSRATSDREAQASAVEGDVAINQAARQRRIAIVAYYRAEWRGFAAGGELEDWLAAEQEIGQNGNDRDMS